MRWSRAIDPDCFRHTEHLFYPPGLPSSCFASSSSYTIRRVSCDSFTHHKNHSRLCVGSAQTWIRHWIRQKSRNKWAQEKNIKNRMLWSSWKTKCRSLLSIFIFSVPFWSDASFGKKSTTTGRWRRRCPSGKVTFSVLEDDKTEMSWSLVGIRRTNIGGT